MADNQPKKRRIVKNPETFRQKAIKANQPEKPSKIKRLASILAMPFKMIYRFIFRPIGRAIAWPFHFKGLRWVPKVLRFIGRILLPRYIRNSWRELRLVNWPSWKESRRLTFAVLVFAIIFGGAIAGVDYGLDKLFKQILLK